MKTDWMAEAACEWPEHDFHRFMVERDGEPTNEVDWARFGALVEICVTCPVLRDCAEFAMRPGGLETEGVWAGTTPRQRIALRAAHDPIRAVTDQAVVNYAKSLTRNTAGEQLGLGVA